MLIFEHAIAYLDRIYEVAHAVMNTAFYTYHDALRVYFMGSQFVAVLRDDGDALISGANVPIPLPLPGKPSPPPLPQRFDGTSGDDNLDRSLRSLERVSLTLKKYGERWEDALALKQSFEMISGEVLASLKGKKRARDASSSSQSQQQQGGSLQQQNSNQGRPQMMHSQSNESHENQQSQYSQQHQFQDVRWSDVNISHMGQKRD
jgi:hypothetical protein